MPATTDPNSPASIAGFRVNPIPECVRWCRLDMAAATAVIQMRLTADALERLALRVTDPFAADDLARQVRYLREEADKLAAQRVESDPWVRDSAA